MSKVSVLVAVYNAEKYLRECLDSLSRQSLRDIQIICVDDASEDHSFDILNEYARSDNRFLVKKMDHNSGQAVARNEGLKYADGDYVCFLDSDDYLSDDALQQMVSVFENHPETDCVLLHLVLIHENGNLEDSVECDSIDLQLFYNGYVGDPNNPMKLEVYPLSFERIIEEDSTYYVNTDLEYFVDDSTKPIATKVFTAINYSVSKEVREGDKYTNNIRIALPKKYGKELLNTYYDHPEFYKNSYTFIRNVCPGFYFKIKSGTGTMLNVSVSTLNLYFTYYEKRDSARVGGLYRFAATPEVIQSTNFSNGNLQQLVEDKSCTYLKSPAGIGTEVTIPVNEIYRNHLNDSISRAQLTLTRYNSNANNEYKLGIPKYILMVRKDNVVSFFKNNKVPNDQTSFCTEFNETYNTYSFENLGRFITYCHYEKLNGMKKSGLSEAQWEAAHPNWNKVVLIPVSVKQTTDANGNSSYAAIAHDMSMSSTRLVGGTNNPIKIQILYSRFK